MGLLPFIHVFFERGWVDISCRRCCPSASFGLGVLVIGVRTGKVSSQNATIRGPSCSGTRYGREGSGTKPTTNTGAPPGDPSETSLDLTCPEDFVRGVAVLIRSKIPVVGAQT